MKSHSLFAMVLVVAGAMIVPTGQARAGYYHCHTSCYCPSPCYYQPCYPCYPCYPCWPCGEVIAASATIVVYLPADAVLVANGKKIELTGPVRILETVPIAIGKTMKVKLSITPPKDKDDEDPPPPGKPETTTKKVPPKKAPPQEQEFELHPYEIKYINFNADKE